MDRNQVPEEKHTAGCWHWRRIRYRPAAHLHKFCHCLTLSEAMRFRSFQLYTTNLLLSAAMLLDATQISFSPNAPSTPALVGFQFAEKPHSMQIYDKEMFNLWLHFRGMEIYRIAFF